MSPEDITGMVGGLTASIIAITCIGILITTGITVLAIVLIKRAVGPNKKVLKEGVDGEATILEVGQTGMMVNNQPQAALKLEVRVPGWEPYQTVIKMVIPIVNIPQFQPGAVMPVKVDPNNKAKVVLNVYG
ncbi:MAG: hypothetical protein JXJ17_02945 [Anaerolineae bacterium]|nr:hypothetical protein [Anaerolineae bacterium]